MILLLKFALFLLIAALLGKGYASHEVQERIKAEKKIKDIQDAAKEAYQLHGAEKTILVNTINELRLELEEVKQRYEIVKRKRSV